MYSFWLQWLLLSIVSAIAVANVHCNQQEIVHIYEKYNEDGSVSRRNHKNFIPATPLNDYAMMRDLCVDTNGLPVFLHCISVKNVAIFDNSKNITCQLDHETTETSNDLTNLLYNISSSSSRSVQFPQVIIKIVGKSLSKSNNTIRITDVVTSNKIIEIVATKPIELDVSTELINVYSQLMTANNSVLNLSAIKYNATNNLLYNFEYYMNRLAHQIQFKSSDFKAKDLVDVIVQDNVTALISDHLSVFYLFPELNSYIGIAVYSKPGPDRSSCQHNKFFYRFLYANQNLEQLSSESDLQVASFLTEQLWKDLQNANVSYLIFKIYANNALFVDTPAQSAKTRPGSYVLSISMPQKSNNSLPTPLPFLLRNEMNQFHGKCGFWNYSSWDMKGIKTSESVSTNPIVVCYTTHLTPFSFLVSDIKKQFEQNLVRHSIDDRQNVDLLDTITAIGSGLSLFGLLGIFVTAAVFRHWRCIYSTKLLLHLSLAMFLLFGLMLLLYINECFWNIEINCIVSGALFQYLVLLQFSWMMLIGYLQFTRHVTVLVARLSHLLIHLVATAWILPMVPTLLLFLIDSTSYKPVKFQPEDKATFCYPTGNGLAYGVILPIGLVLIANTFTLLSIGYTTSKLKNMKGLTYLQFRLFVLLFFLLGLTWIFGICCYLELGLVSSFLFCITATIQGFVLFVYFVVFDKVARTAWLQLLTGKPQKVHVELSTT